jgi:hypothetical protein
LIRAKVDGQRRVRVLLSDSWRMEMQVSEHNGEEQNDAYKYHQHEASNVPRRLLRTNRFFSAWIIIKSHVDTLSKLRCNWMIAEFGTLSSWRNTRRRHFAIGEAAQYRILKNRKQ